MTRRTFVPLAALAAVTRVITAQGADQPIQRKGRLKQCVTGGVFGRGHTLEENAQNAARMGAKGFDLIGPKDWPTLKKYGLLPTMCPGFGGPIPDALNRNKKQ